MKEKLVIEKAKYEDIAMVLNILKENSEWLESLGIKQWEKDYYLVKFNEEYYKNAIDKGQLYVGKIDGLIVGTFVLRDYDPAWEDDGVSNYICNMGVALKYHGNEIGKTMIEFAKKYCVSLGIEKLKLDCVSENERLNKYYNDLGFKLLTIVVVNDRYTASKRSLDLVQ